MKKILAISLFLLCGFSAFAQSSTKAKKLLDDVAAEMNAYKNMKLNFMYTFRNEIADIEQNDKGYAIIEGDNYIFNLLGNSFIFNGKQTYVINPENLEVNVLEETSEEQTLNPKKLLFFYNDGFTYQWKENKIVAGKNIQYIKLIPIDSNSDSLYYLVGVDLKSKQIYSITNFGKNDSSTTFKVESLSTNTELPVETFQFDEQKYIDQDYIINK